jgi:ferric-dicitrate binding protein FerR (iron transport regulator)
VGGIAASLLVVAFFGISYVTNQNEVLFAENGQNQTIELGKGSEVWLNDGSTVEYNARNWENQRTIELSGEALFEVTKGSPFIVKTKNGSIRVLGTQFNVRAWGDNLFVECYEGRVEVMANQQEKILTANESVHVLQGEMSEKKPISNTSPFWQNSTSRFYEEQLEDVFEELERQFDVKVNSTASGRSFSGSFGHQDLESALRSICKPLGLEFTISQDKKTIAIE